MAALASQIYDPKISKDEKEQILSLVGMEGFQNKWISYDVLLKTILFTLVFYLVSSDLISIVLSRYLPKMVDKILIQALIFGLLYYLISIQI